LLTFKGHFARFQNPNDEQTIPMPGEEMNLNMINDIPGGGGEVENIPLPIPDNVVPY
jgi:replicative DNA helicase